MNKANHIPYAWEEIEAQVLDAILAQAGAGPSTGTA